jgi:hypothetical protein
MDIKSREEKESPMINRLGGVNGMDYSQGLPTPDGAGDLGDLIPAGKSGAAIGLVASVLAAAAGFYISVKSYKKAPMPSTLKKAFRTNAITWYEPDVPLFVVGTALEVGGAIGLIVSINRLMAKD